jgi:hypothetical protein
VFGQGRVREFHLGRSTILLSPQILHLNIQLARAQREAQLAVWHPMVLSAAKLVLPYYYIFRQLNI